MGLMLLGGAFAALMLIAYLVAAAEEGLWPFHRILGRTVATRRSDPHGR